MKIDRNLIKEHINKAFDKGYIQINDHRKNIIVLENGIFKYNDCQQPKLKPSIETIFLEAFRLSRFVRLDSEEYIRERSKWVKISSLNKNSKTH